MEYSELRTEDLDSTKRNIEPAMISKDEASNHGKGKNMDIEANRNTKPNGLHKAWPSAGKIEFRNVWLKYREGLEPALKKANLTINAGETVGLVGRTGAGKSTIMMALFRIVELSQGEVLIDDVNITDVSKNELRSKLTLIPQDPVLSDITWIHLMHFLMQNLNLQ